jgi:hypothetical protein
MQLAYRDDEWYYTADYMVLMNVTYKIFPKCFQFGPGPDQMQPMLTQFIGHTVSFRPVTNFRAIKTM